VFNFLNLVYSSKRKDKMSKHSKRSKRSKKSKRCSPKHANPFFRPVQLKPELASFMKKSSACRTEIVSCVWKHIRKHDLQDSRDVHLDGALADAFRLSSPRKVSMFDIPKLIAKNVVK